MSNNPFLFSTDGLTTETAAAITLLMTKLASATDDRAGSAAAQTFSEVIEKLRQIGA